jgi:hypothetical protein
MSTNSQSFLDWLASSSEPLTAVVDGDSSIDRVLSCAADSTNPVPAPLPLKPRSWRDTRQQVSPIDDAPAAETMATIKDDNDAAQFRHPSRPTKRNPNSWSPEEDQQLIESVMQNGTRNWACVSSTMQSLSQGVSNRTGKQCRERWHNHLDPTLSHAPFTAEEDAKLIRLQGIFDNKWTEISKRMPGRSDNAVKNRWNSSLNKTIIYPADIPPGRKRSRPAESVSDSACIVAPRVPLQELDAWHANVQWGKTPLGNIQQTVTAALPCAVRSVHRTPPHVTDFCFADKCSNIAQYGFRSASGQVRRTRCMAHHEAGMYALLKSRHC